MAAAGMHDDAGRLVDHQQVRIGVGDRVGGTRDGGHGGGVTRRAVVHRDALAAAQAVALGPPDAVHPHRSGLDQALGARAGSHQAGQKRIQTSSGGAGGRGELPRAQERPRPGAAWVSTT